MVKKKKEMSFYPTKTIYDSRGERYIDVWKYFLTLKIEWFTEFSKKSGWGLTMLIAHDFTWKDQLELMELIYKEVPEEFNSRALQERNPQYIIVVKGIGVSGDPDTMEDPSVEQYFEELISGNLDYTVLVSFKTPNFLSFRQIVATNPTCTILGRKSSL